jgi:hypothetical protein
MVRGIHINNIHEALRKHESDRKRMVAGVMPIGGSTEPSDRESADGAALQAVSGHA